MTFVPVKPTGWTTGVDTIRGEDLTAMQAQIVLAVDGGAGGAYNPTTTLTIGGQGLTMAGTSNVKLVNRQLWRHQDMLGFSESANWTVRPYNVWRNTAVGGTAYFSLNRLLNGGTLTDVCIRWCGAAGHAAWPGGKPVMPLFDLYRVSLDGVAGLIGTMTDPTATHDEYEVAHDILLTGLAEVIDLTTYRYQIILTGETGANFVANAEALSLAARITATAMSEY